MEEVSKRGKENLLLVIFICLLLGEFVYSYFYLFVVRRICLSYFYVFVVKRGL